MINVWAPKQKGFTIVELLIVIVVIAILAAITVVAYNGITRRANNAAIVSAVSQTHKNILAHIAQEGTYPYTSNGNACVTVDSGCVLDGGSVIASNTTFNTNMAKIATPPRSVPNVGSLANGIMYSYSAGRTHNGDVQPALLFYFLNGTSQDCGMAGVMNHWTTSTTPANPYTSANASATGKTLCYITIPGPSA